MKKTAIFIIVLLLLGLYATYNSLFPKADKINYPDYSQVESITASTNGEVFDLSQEECRVLYNCIRKAKPTRKMSANDTPDVKNYWNINIEADSLPFRYGYIYEIGGKTYFEIPYVGIYSLDLSWLDHN